MAEKNKVLNVYSAWQVINLDEIVAGLELG
jgi:hypothetical protein